MVTSPWNRGCAPVSMCFIPCSSYEWSHMWMGTLSRHLQTADPELCWVLLHCIPKFSETPLFRRRSPISPPLVGAGLSDTLLTSRSQSDHDPGRVRQASLFLALSGATGSGGPSSSPRRGPRGEAPGLLGTAFGCWQPWLTG